MNAASATDRISVIDSDEQTARIRTLRAKGLSPMDSARVLGFPPATAARLVRANAAEQGTDPAQREVLGCRVNPGWSAGLTIHGRPDWIDLPRPDTGAEDLVAVVVAVTLAGAGSASAATWSTCTASG